MCTEPRWLAGLKRPKKMIKRKQEAAASIAATLETPHAALATLLSELDHTSFHVFSCDAAQIIFSATKTSFVCSHTITRSFLPHSLPACFCAHHNECGLQSVFFQIYHLLIDSCQKKERCYFDKHQVSKVLKSFCFMSASLSLTI